MAEKETKPVLEEGKEKKKFNIAKKWWFWVIIGVLVVGTIGAIAGAGSSNSSNNNNNNSSNATTYGMNEVVSVRELEFKVTDVYDTKRCGSEYVGQSTENNFAVVTFQIKNLTTNEKTITSNNFKYYRGVNEYEASSAGIYLGENGFYVLEDIGAGLTKTIVVAYEIPTTHEANDYILAKDSYKTEKIYLK